MFIIGDVAGQYDALMDLVKYVKPDEEIVLVGDLNDRGLKSKEVIEWAMTTPNVVTLNSNHGDMFIDWYLETGIYDTGVFVMNGGDKTIRSYCPEDYYGGLSLARQFINPEHIEFLRTRPMYYMKDGIFVSHAPWCAGITLEQACDISTLVSRENTSLLWNRDEPEDRPGLIQVYGHNSYWGLKFQGSTICIDTSQEKVLTGIRMPGEVVYQVRY